MKLTDEQQSTVRAWAEAGASLNDLQNQLRDEMGLNLTFLDVRFLVLDLGITLKSDPVEEPAPVSRAPRTKETPLNFLKHCFTEAHPHRWAFFRSANRDRAVDLACLPRRHARTSPRCGGW